MTKTTTIRISTEMNDQLEKIGRAHRRSINNTAVGAIQEFIDRERLTKKGVKLND